MLLPIAPPAFQGLANRFDDRFPNAGRIAKAHFPLGRVHIHIHRGGIELEKEKRDRKLPLHERGVVALAQGGREHRAFNGAAVDEDELLRAALPAHSRLANQAR